MAFRIRLLFSAQCFNFLAKTLKESFQTSGPLLPILLKEHSMVKLGKGQAILGGVSKTPCPRRTSNPNFISQDFFHFFSLIDNGDNLNK